MISRSCRFLYGLDRRVADKERVLDCPLIRKPDGQTQQCVDGGSVASYRTEDAHSVELLDDACSRLAVAPPDGGKFDLGSHELPWL